MSNPAAELLKIFSNWVPTGTASSYQAHGNGSDEFAAEHRRAMKLIWDIEQAVDRWEAEQRTVDTYRRGIQAWTRYTLGLPNGWTNAHSGSQDRQVALIDTLEALADRMDAAPRVAEPQLQEMGVFLGGIVDLLASDESIPATLRSYILELVTEIQHALDQHRVLGSFDFSDSLERLWVALTAARGESKEAKRKWAKLRDQILIPASVQLLAGTPTTVLAIASTVSGSE
jgi:ATP-dependent exoDNAse (exonuclease V) beta subunit